MIDRDTVIAHLMDAGVIEEDGCGLFLCAGLSSEVIDAALAIAQKAVDGQKQTRRETEAMAECMDMVRQDLITAGVVDKSVPPMMLAEAVIAAQHKAVLAERSAIDEMHEAEELWAPIGHSSWGEGYQEGWGDGIKAYVGAIRARGTGGEG